jgi:hypothetical protein
LTLLLAVPTIAFLSLLIPVRAATAFLSLLIAVLTAAALLPFLFVHAGLALPVLIGHRRPPQRLYK